MEGGYPYYTENEQKMWIIW